MMSTKNFSAIIPACVLYDPAQVTKLSDVIYLLQHEVDLYEEGQDGALSTEEIDEVHKTLRKLRNR